MPWIDVPSEYVFQFEAIDPSTGAAITGVTVSDIAIIGEDLGSGVVARRVPLLTPEEVESLN